MTINGKEFKGGQFIPKQDLEQASEEEIAVLQRKESGIGIVPEKLVSRNVEDKQMDRELQLARDFIATEIIPRQNLDHTQLSEITGKSGFLGVNDFLRSDGTQSTFAKEQVDFVNAEFDKESAQIPVDVTVFRGTGLKNLPQKGDTLSDKGYVFTSLSPRLASTFTETTTTEPTDKIGVSKFVKVNPVVLQINVKKGTKAVGVQKTRGGKTRPSDEADIVLNRGSHFRVTNIVPKDGFHVIEVEVTEPTLESVELARLMEPNAPARRVTTLTEQILMEAGLAVSPEEAQEQLKAVRENYP